MTARPRAGSVAAPAPPHLLEPGIKSNSSHSLLPNHTPNSPFIVTNGIVVRLTNLVVNEEAHLFVCLQLRNSDDVVLEAKPRSRTEVSSCTRNIIQFHNNSFSFDIRPLHSTRTSNTPHLLHRSNSSLSPGINIPDSLHGLEIYARVFQVFPREDDGQGYTKQVAYGKLPLSYIVNQPGFQFKEEIDTNTTLNGPEGVTARLVKQGSTISNNLDSLQCVDDNGFPTTISLSHVLYDEEDNVIDTLETTDGRYQGSDEQDEENSFGQLNISVELRRQVRIVLDSIIQLPNKPH